MGTAVFCLDQCVQSLMLKDVCHIRSYYNHWLFYTFLANESTDLDPSSPMHIVTLLFLVDLLVNFVDAKSTKSNITISSERIACL